MSTTIGFGCTLLDEGLLDEFERLTAHYGYGLQRGLIHSDVDVKLGIAKMQSIELWQHVLVLHSPLDGPPDLAFGIDQEFSRFETLGERPKFFDLLLDIAARCAHGCTKLGVFFAGEWSAQDRVRYSYGDIHDLVTLLSMPGYWGMRYMIPETGHLQDSDEIPFVFDLRLKIARPGYP